jgi:putative membrane protein
MMTRRFHLTLMLTAAALSLAACGQADTAAQPPATAAESKVDATFINTAGKLGLAEARLAQLMATAAADPATRDFARKIAADHATVEPQLAALAQDQGLAPASDMDAAHETLYRQLQTLRGPAIDRAYMTAQLRDLTMLIEAYQSEADSGKIPQVRSFAQQYLPMMQQHLQLALTVPAAAP